MCKRSLNSLVINRVSMRGQVLNLHEAISDRHWLMLCQMVTCGGTCKQVFVDYGSFRLGKGNHPSTGGLLTGLATLNKSPISSLVVRGLDAGDVQPQNLLSSFLIAFGDRLTWVDVSTCFLLHSHLQQLGYCKNLRSLTMGRCTSLSEASLQYFWTRPNIFPVLRQVEVSHTTAKAETIRVLLSTHSALTDVLSPHLPGMDLYDLDIHYPQINFYTVNDDNASP